VAQGDSGPDIAALVARRVIDVPDFPKEGIVFKDLGRVFADGPTLRAAIDAMARAFGAGGFDVVAGIEARGFLIAAALGYATGTGVVPIRKVGKLPRRTLSATYQLEYGEATLEVQEDAFLAGQRVLLVDDVLATGGTAAAAARLVAQAGGDVVGFAVILELSFLSGREALAGHTTHALLRV
jgi:adenine phosphoribosyltransferase